MRDLFRDGLELVIMLAFCAMIGFYAWTIATGGL